MHHDHAAHLAADSMQVYKGVQALLEAQKLRRKHHKDLWARIAAAIVAKGAENFKVVHVPAHQKKSEQSSDPREQSRRKRNEQADTLAVKGAKDHATPVSIFLKRKATLELARMI